MTMKKIILAALTGTALLAAAPAFADNGRGDRRDFRGDRHHFRGDRHDFRGDRHDFRGDRHDFRGDRHDFRGGHRGNHFQGHWGNHFQGRPVVVHRPAYGYGYGYDYGYRPAIVHRPAYDYYAPRHDVLGGLILGTVIGVAIANHNSY